MEVHGARRRRGGSVGGGAGLGWRRRVVSGAQAAQARSRAARAWLGRAREAVSGREVCGAAAKQCRSGARAAAEGRRRSGGGGAAYGRGCRAAVLRGGRKTVKLTRGPAEGLSENKTGEPANPRHRKVRWYGEKNVGVITGVSLTRSERD